MKKIIFSAVFMMAAWMGANAMSFERAQAEALYLTDKMAYELNLNDQQYNDAYEINLDYFLSIGSPADLYGVYYNHRINDLRCILHDWQYSLFFAADYFLRPLVWRAGNWFFPVYARYNRGFFYYSYPSVWRTYYGGHSRYHHHNGFYVNRRPHWNGGLRGRDMHHPSAGMHHSSPGMGNHGAGGHRPGGSNGYRGGGSNGNVNHGGSGNHGGGGSNGNVNHGGSGNHGGGSSNGNVNHGGSGNHGGSSNHGSVSRGNSFDGSSSRMSGGRGGSSYGGSSRSGSHSMSSGSHSMSGGSRGGSFGGGHGGSSRSGGMGGGNRGGGGGSRGGRR